MTRDGVPSSRSVLDEGLLVIKTQENEGERRSEGGVNRTRWTGERTHLLSPGTKDKVVDGALRSPREFGGKG